MPRREIRLFGDPVLRMTCQTVDIFDSRALSLAEDLLDTADPEGRAAVAAPQIGVPLRAFAYSLDGRRGCIFNPVVTHLGGDYREISEACLSVPKMWFDTPRWSYAVVEGQDEYGAPITVEGEDVFAQMLQHETDHLQGTVFVQTLPKARKRFALGKIREEEWFKRGKGVVSWRGTFQEPPDVLPHRESR